jgi:hypothetical protein
MVDIIPAKRFSLGNVFTGRSSVDLLLVGFRLTDLVAIDLAMIDLGLIDSMLIDLILIDLMFIG